tara:strand:- start:11389 stop:11898 length:510 start_codon:yes stop_codon:yes gene_type:complete
MLLLKSLIKTVLMAGLVSCPLLSHAGEPPEGVPQAYIDAGETIIDVGYSLSEPFDNGDYITTSIRPEGLCGMTKTQETYSEGGDHLKTIVTTYDLARIDPETIQSDNLGGIKFLAIDGAPVFPQRTVFGGNFAMDLPGDNLSVDDAETDIEPMIEALSYLVEYCTTPEA